MANGFVEFSGWTLEDCFTPGHGSETLALWMGIK